MTSSNKSPSEALDAISVAQFSADGMVTLLVGKNEQTTIAQGDYLTRDSEFFAAAMKKEWQEGQKRTIKLPEECPATMAHYLSFMHSGKLFAEEIATMDGNQILPCYEMLASLYVCGERFLNRPLQSAIIKQSLRLFTIAEKNQTFWAPTDYSVNIIYRGTPEGSPDRRLLVDLQVVMGHKGWLDRKLDLEFVTDVAKAYCDKVESLPWRKKALEAEKYMHAP
jgi:hypothetical protein